MTGTPTNDSLAAGYDGVLLDLDGTVYRGTQVVPGAPEAIAGLRAAGGRVAFVTNNASRSPGDVAEHLVGLGVEADPGEVVTSAQAAAKVLAELVPAGGAVLILGTDALADEVCAAGLRPVRTADEQPVAVVQGHSPDTGWAQLAEACLAVRAGALWVACNIDPTLPTERGQLPGNGSMVAALRTATGQQPVVAGKPARPLVATATERLGAPRSLVVGDRLDTDVAAGVATGLDALLVLTGVSTAADLLAAAPAERPQFVGADLAALHRPAGESRVGARPGWTGEHTAGGIVLRGDGEPLDALRTLCAAWWAGAGGSVTVTAADPGAERAVRELGLGD